MPDKKMSILTESALEASRILKEVSKDIKNFSKEPFMKMKVSAKSVEKENIQWQELT